MRKFYIIENICFILLSQLQNTFLKYCTISDEYSVKANLDLGNIKPIFIENNKMKQKLQREYQRAQCVALSNAGLSCRKTSQFTGISKSSVQCAIKRFEEKGDFHDRRRSGRSKKLNDRNIRMLKRLTENDDHYSSHETTNKLNNSLKNPLCKTTVITYFHKNSYEYKTKIKKSFLTIKQKRERLNWCLAHSNWTVNDWRRAIFSDETTFYVIKRKK